MTLETETSVSVEHTSLHDKEATARRRRRQGRLQFWSCTFMSVSLLFIGAWLYPANGPESVDRPILGNAAVTLWLCIPSLVYFAWQGYRQMRAGAGVRVPMRRTNAAKRLVSADEVCQPEIVFGSRVARRPEI
jgi:hypothetical protein